MIATGVEAPVVAAGATEEELEKRLVALCWKAAAHYGRQLLAAARGRFPLPDFDASEVKPRILGKSETPDVFDRCVVMGPGKTSHRRRHGTADNRLQARSEMRNSGNAGVPVRAGGSRQGIDGRNLVVAALTVLRAYHVGGRPGGRPRWARSRTGRTSCAALCFGSIALIPSQQWRRSEWPTL